MFKRAVLAAGVLAVSQGVQAQSTEELQKQVDILAQEVESLKQQDSGNGDNQPYFGGYGEHHYNNYRGNTDDNANTADADDMVDTHRFVLFMGYDFSDSIRFASELEIEHAYAGEGEPGAVELEQAYVEFDTSESTRLKAGMFLVPVGILNETHEPDTFYGVERNELESRLIPSTWWETGAMFSQDLGGGLSYDLAFHSGLETGPDYSIRGGRQKSAKATGNDGAWTGRIKFNGVSGLELAATMQRQNDLHQSAPGVINCGPNTSNRSCSLGFNPNNSDFSFSAGDNVPDANAQLLEYHARYKVAGFKLTAQRAEWDIDSDIADNNGTDKQEGTMLEAGYKVTDQVGVFARGERLDNDAGSGDATDSETDVTTAGVNYWPHPRVVVKADYQSFTTETNSSEDTDDRFNLGVGWSF